MYVVICLCVIVCMCGCDRVCVRGEGVEGLGLSSGQRQCVCDERGLECCSGKCADTLVVGESIWVVREESRYLCMSEPPYCGADWLYLCLA